MVSFYKRPIIVLLNQLPVKHLGAKYIPRFKYMWMLYMLMCATLSCFLKFGYCHFYCVSLWYGLKWLPMISFKYVIRSTQFSTHIILNAIQYGNWAVCPCFMQSRIVLCLCLYPFASNRERVGFCWSNSFNSRISTVCEAFNTL